MKLNFVVFAVMVLFLFGCKSKKETTEVEEKKEVVVVKEEPKFDMEEAVGDYRIVLITNTPEFNEVSPTLIIEKDGKVSGNNGCNSYFGTINPKGDAIFSNIGSTRMACDGEASDVESDLNVVFESANNI